MVRQSMACFVHPDPDFVIGPLDNSDKYQPITDREYFLQRLEAIHIY
jgi:hypothetical protein